MTEMKIDLGWEDVTLIVNGDEYLIGFDEKRHCFHRLWSLKEFSSVGQLEKDQLNFEKKFSDKVRRLFLNRNETILTIETTEKLCFLLLPTFSSKKIHQCSIEEFPSNDKSNETIRINFHWLTNKEFLLVFLTKNRCEYQLVRYAFESNCRSKWNIGGQWSLERSKEENFLRETLPVDQRSDLIRIDSIEIKSVDNIIFVFIYKFNGEIFLLKLLSNSIEKSSLTGPLKLCPFRSDNYLSKTTSTRILCSKTSSERVLLFTFNSIEINEFLLLTNQRTEKDEGEEILYSIDRIRFSVDDQREIRSIHLDRFDSNCFYLIDSLSNIYSVGIPSLDDEEFLSRQIEEIYSQRNFSLKRKYSSTIENHFNGNLFLFVNQTKSNEKKILELEFVRRRRSRIKTESRPKENSSRLAVTKSSKRDFLDRIQSILHFQPEQRKRLDDDQHFQILFDQIEKNLIQQEKIHREFENKQKFLFDLLETQKFVENEFCQHFSSQKIQFDRINEMLEQEVDRHEHLRQDFKRKFSSSNDENLFRRFEIQKNSLKEKFRQIESIFNEQNQRKVDSTIDESKMQPFESFVEYYRDKIFELNDKMKQLRNNRIE